MSLTGMVTSKISRVLVTVATLVTAAILAFGGLSSVGAQAATTYDCGTYGGGSYDQTDCSDGTTSSGTPSSSTSSSSSTSGTIVLNDFPEYFSASGKSLTFKVGDVFHFILNGTQHTITVKTFDASKLIVTIASTPTDVTVPIGQTVNYDVDQDGTADIAITYSNISPDNATATASFRSLNTTTPAPTGTSTGSTSNTSNGGTTDSTKAAAYPWWIWILPIVIGLALLAWAIAAARRRKAARNAANGGTGANFNQF